MNFRVPFAVLCAGTVLLLAGCSVHAKATAAPSPPILHCDKAPDTTVGTALGIQISPVQETDQAPVTVCTYPLKSGAGVVVLRFQTVVDTGRFAEIRKGFAGPTTDVAGYHDEAFTASSGSGDAALNSLAARSGSTAIVVTAGVPVDKEKALLDQLFGAV
jgi:hypothetical protein